MSSGLAKGFSESPSQTWSDGACPAIPEVSSSPPPGYPCDEDESAATPHPAHQQVSGQQRGSLAEGSVSTTAAAGECNGLADAEVMTKIAVRTSDERSSAAAAEALGAPRSQEPPGRTPWWLIPSKFIPGIGPVPPLAVC